MAEEKKLVKISGKRKVAILLITLGPELASAILKHFKDEEIEEISLQIANTEYVQPEEREKVLDEFYTMIKDNIIVGEGGIEYVRDLLVNVVGAARANEVIAKIQGAISTEPFAFIKNADPKEILNLTRKEHPQTIALILAYLDSDLASAVFSSLPPELQVVVAKKIAMMERANPEIIAGVEDVLKEKTSVLSGRDYADVDGVKALARILGRADRNTEKMTLEALEAQNRDLADEVRKSIFLFEDIMLLEDQDLQKVLNEVDTKDLVLAMRGADERVNEKIFGNLSSRAAAVIKEEMEYMGPVRLRHTEEAQQKIVSVVRRLEGLGEIVIARGGEEDVFV
jgi:flagellar motor switch protein FliG